MNWIKSRKKKFAANTPRSEANIINLNAELIENAEKGNIVKVRELLQTGADVNAKIKIPTLLSCGQAMKAIWTLLVLC